MTGTVEVSALYPTTERMAQRWTALGREIAANVSYLSRPAEAGCKGQLVVLGSGIAHGNLTIETETELRAADHVFYSINDHVTKSWLNALRPDAYDLAILYNEQIERGVTYTRMAEAMLHYVRQGKKVAAIFYGHPGVFAAPGHRAIRIARKEGHAAIMKPGISALDCLIADIGFDPALPGMITYEASDMILRKRRIDTTLHMVIWQVGVVGEFGFNRQGYTNRGFGVLIDRLQEAYGPDWKVTHYIGSQYAGLEPRIQNIPIHKLRDPAVARRLGTLSTFYIRPRHAMDTDAECAKALGAALLPAAPAPTGAASVRPSTGLRHYGSTEIEALRTFAELSVSPGYSVIQRGGLLDLLMALANDADLRDRFGRDPASVLSSSDYDELTVRQKELLATRSPRAVAAALR